MGRKRIGGFVFVTYAGDHPPYHVHIYEKEIYIGRFDIEHQRPMDKFELTMKLRKALQKAGYLLGEL